MSLLDEFYRRVVSEGYSQNQKIKMSFTYALVILRNARLKIIHLANFNLTPDDTIDNKL